MSAERFNSRSAWVSLLREHQIRPDKRLGQHFLFDLSALDRVVAAAELRAGQTVLEIGAGVGALTRALAARAQRVIAVEFDRRLLPALSEAVADLGQVQVVLGDILSMPLDELVVGSPYAVVANIPYNLTSAILRKLMEAATKPAVVVLTVQREVAERITAGPGQMSLLALGVQVYGEPEIRGHIQRDAFYPAPDVDSAILRIVMREQPFWDSALDDWAFSLARAGFGQRRKQLKNALAIGLGAPVEQTASWLREVGIDPARRAQTLTLEEWALLAGGASGWMRRVERDRGG